MMTSFQTLTPEESLEVAIDGLLAGNQRDFPVVVSGEIVGMLRRDTLLEALAKRPQAACVADVMTRDCVAVVATLPLQTVFEQMNRDDCSSLPVVHNGRLIGIVSLENIGEWLMIQSALRGSGRDV